MNLISIGRLDEDGFGNSFCDGIWKLSKGSLVIARGKKVKSNLYLMQASVFGDDVNVVEKQNSPELWHRRLSHISAKGLETLVKKNAISGLNNANLEKCSHCFAGKKHRVSFKTHQPHRMQKPIGLGAFRCLWSLEGTII